MAEILKTDRLWLRQFKHADAEALFAIYTGADVMRYMTRQPPATVGDVHKHLDSLIADYDLYGFGFWAVPSSAILPPIGMPQRLLRRDAVPDQLFECGPLCVPALLRETSWISRRGGYESSLL